MIDAYSHCGISKYLPLEDVLATIEAADVERAVLCQHLGEYDNTYLASVVEKRPDMFRAVCLVDPVAGNWREALRDAHAGGAFRGLRVVAATLLENPALCAEALRLGLTLVVWAEDGVADVVDALRALCADHPDGRVVITHLGAPRVENGAAVAGWELLELAGEPGVFVTLSGQSMFCDYPYAELSEFVVRVIDAFGTGRVMWGSNYPVCGDAAAYRRDLAQLTSGGWGLGPREVAQIANGTAARLWFDEDPQA